VHEQAYDFCRLFADDIRGHGLEIGGRDLNGNARGLWPRIVWTVLDVLPGPGVDIVADARTWVPDRGYQIVLCTEVLEHVEDWRLVVNTAAKALDPGGLVVITCAGPGRPPHSGVEATDILPGEYYHNISPVDLGDTLRASGLVVDTCQLMGFDTQAVAIQAYSKH
jgi:hypothetical protein